MTKIDINKGEVESHSSNIESAASGAEISGLSVIDEVSTIKGNQLAQNAFKEAQSLIEELVKAMSADATKIRTLGDEFDAVDNQLALMIKSLR